MLRNGPTIEQTKQRIGLDKESSTDNLIFVLTGFFVFAIFAFLLTEVCTKQDSKPSEQPQGQYRNPLDHQR